MRVEVGRSAEKPCVPRTLPKPADLQVGLSDAKTGAALTSLGWYSSGISSC